MARCFERLYKRRMVRLYNEKIMKIYYRRNNCRVCNSTNLTKVLDLNKTPLANAFVSKENLKKKEKTFPLSVYFCNNCSLVQIPDVVNPEILFSDYYFITASSSPLIDHFKKYIKSKSDLVIDIGGNDATLLNELKNDCKVLNIEPAKNIAEISKKRGIETINQFFSKKVAKGIIKKYGHATVVTANNIIAHTDTVRELFEGVGDIIGDKGVFIFEAHWVKNLLVEGCFDQIYHEHLCYYSLHAIKYLANSVGLSIFDVKTVPTQGQSLRVYVAKNKKPLPSVSKFIKIEQKNGLHEVKTFADFSKNVIKNKANTVKLLNDLKSKNKKIVGYGAPAKGTTLLNFYEVGPKIIDYIIDTTPIKQGLYVPGVHIPIYHPEKLYQSKPDYILLLAWNYADTILEKEKDLREMGVKFIIPVPEVKIV